MAFPWVAVALGGASLVGGLIQGNQQRQQADAANETNEEMVEARYERDLQEWEISYLESMSNYAWSIANTEAQRYVDRVNRTDYEANQERVIDAALLNLELNTEALQDQYVTSEKLRALEANMTFDNEIDKQLYQRNTTLSGLDRQRDRSILTKNQKIEAARVAYKNGFNRQQTQFRTGRAIEQGKFLVGKNSALRTRALTEADLGLNQMLKQAEINTDAAIRKAEIDNRAAQSNLAAMEAVAAYMNSIKQRGQQADQIVAEKENQGKAIQEQIIIGEKLDTIQRDAEYITAIVESADKKAGAVARGGGSNSARRVALDSLQRFGRSYGELKMIQADRRRSMTNYNAELTGTTANELARIATAIEGERDRISYTNKANALKNEGFKLAAGAADAQSSLASIALNATTDLGMARAASDYDANMNQLKLTKKSNIRQLQDTRRLNMQDLRTKRMLDIGFARADNKLNLKGFGQQRQEARKLYNINSKFLLKNFNKLTVPGFELARRAGDREYSALVNSTLNTVKGAARPYREAIIFDPLEPIAGLKPEKGMFTPVAKPSYGSILANSFLQGVQGALSMSYTDANGNLAFR